MRSFAFIHLFIYLQNFAQVKTMDEGSNMIFTIDCIGPDDSYFNVTITLKFCECQSPDGKSKCPNLDGNKKVC